MVDTAVDDDRLKVIEGPELVGDINTPQPELLANIRHSIRLGYPQVQPQPPQPERVCLVGGGPSLEATFPELRDLYFAGAKIVTVNGAYRWCLERNLRPSAQIMLDARSFNARFVDPAVPACKYLLASQCHPVTFDAVRGRNVWIWHAIGPENALREELDQFYLKAWTGVAGGTTVIMRAIALLRILGFLRFDLFGVDSCFLDGQHHAYPQTENDDRPHPWRVKWPDYPERAREFLCSGWHLKQLEDFLQMVRINGHQFLIHVHGDGLLAYALRASASTFELESVDAAAGEAASRRE